MVGVLSPSNQLAMRFMGWEMCVCVCVGGEAGIAFHFFPFFIHENHDGWE